MLRLLKLDRASLNLEMALIVTLLILGSVLTLTFMGAGINNNYGKAAVATNGLPVPVHFTYTAVNGTVVKIWSGATGGVVYRTGTVATNAFDINLPPGIYHATTSSDVVLHIGAATDFTVTTGGTVALIP